MTTARPVTVEEAIVRELDAATEAGRKITAIRITSLAFERSVVAVCPGSLLAWRQGLAEIMVHPLDWQELVRAWRPSGRDAFGYSPASGRIEWFRGVRVERGGRVAP